MILVEIANIWFDMELAGNICKGPANGCRVHILTDVSHSKVNCGDLDSENFEADFYLGEILFRYY